LTIRISTTIEQTLGDGEPIPRATIDA